MKVKYRVQAGWGYVVETHDDNGIHTRIASGDAWASVHEFGTGQMRESVLREAALFLAEVLSKRHDNAEIIEDNTLCLSSEV